MGRLETLWQGCAQPTELGAGALPIIKKRI